MSKRGESVAFYGLLLCVVALAITLWLVPLHHHTKSSLSGVGTTVPTKSPPRSATRTGSVRSGKGEDHSTKARAQRRAPVVTVAAVRGPSWLVVRARYTGRLLYRGMLEQGHSLRLRGSALWAQIGAASNIEVRVRHRLIELGQGTRTGVILTAQGAVPTQPGGAGVVGS